LFSGVVIFADQPEAEGCPESFEDLVATCEFSEISIDHRGILFEPQLTLKAHTPFLGGSVSEFSRRPGLEIPVFLSCSITRSQKKK
jgi:hypothetical protein